MGQMEMMNIWNDFQMMKAYVIEFALKKKEDVMYLDCDIIILQPLNFIDKNYQLPPSSLSFETNIRHTKKKDENIHLEEKRSIWREKVYDRD